MDIINKKVSDLIPYANNARTHNEDQIQQIASSIKEFGFTNPILLDEKYAQVIVQRYIDYTSNTMIRINGVEIDWEDYKNGNK